MVIVNGLSLINPIDPARLQKETQRIYEVCDGCRRCFNLCPSFNTLLDGIDRYEGDVVKLTPSDHHRVVDECYYCKLCYNHCPYTPPHKYQLDFPRLMIAWKKLLAQGRPVPWRDRLLVRSDWIGKLGTTLAPLMNWANTTRWIREILHRMLGVHRDRRLVKFQEETFPHWLERTRGDSRRPPVQGVAKVALFSTCLIDYHESEIGQ